MTNRIKSYKLSWIIVVISLFILTILIIPIKEKNSLKLNGKENIMLSLGAEYKELGVTYKGQDVTAKTVINNNLNNNEEGEYKIIYTYKTIKGKTLKTVRKVIVK